MLKISIKIKFSVKNIFLKRKEKKRKENKKNLLGIFGNRYIVCLLE